MAKQYAEETITNKDKQQYFLDGVTWTVNTILDTMSSAHHPIADDRDNAFMKNLAWKDVKKVLMDLKQTKTEASNG